MNTLTRDQLLSPRKLPRATIDLPDLGGAVIVRGLTAAERDAYEASMVQMRKGRGALNEESMRTARARIVQMGAINEDGSPLFAPADIAQIGNLPAAAVERLFDAIRRLSGMSDADIEELAGNSAGGPNGDSRSGSPSP